MAFQVRHELFLQHHACSVQPHLDEIDVNSQRSGGFFLIQFFDVSEYENFAIFVWQDGDSLAQLLAEFLLFEGLEGDFAPVSQDGRGVVAGVLLGRLIEGLFGSGFELAEALAGFVHGNGDQPGAKFGLSAKRLKVAERGDHDFLGGVFSFGLVFEYGEDGDVNEALVGANELVEELSLATANAGDEIGFVGDSERLHALWADYYTDPIHTSFKGVKSNRGEAEN